MIKLDYMQTQGNRKMAALPTLNSIDTAGWTWGN